MPAVPADGAVADGDAESEQLAPDALRAPEPVLLREPADEVPHLPRYARPPRGSPRAPPPPQPPALPVPAQHSFRLHQHEMTPPVRAHAAGQHPEHPIAPPNPWAGA